MARTAAIIAAAGSGERLGSKIPKALVQLAGRTLIEHAFSSISPLVDEVVIAAPADYEERFRNLFGESAKVVTGGATRSISIAHALEVVSPNIDFIVVHDAARALASTALAARVIEALNDGEVAVIPALPVVDTIKSINSDGYVTLTPDRTNLRAVQTPQGFTRQILNRAHQGLDRNPDATDDAALVESLGEKVKVIEGESRALKITTSDDLERAMVILGLSHSDEVRSGVGVDAHAFSSDPDRKLHLACLEWAGEVGVDGHSDGDVAAHAICDALFSAAALGDLGSNFGVDDPRYAGASGATLLREASNCVKSSGFEILNVSVQIVGNRPKLSPRRREAISALSIALGGVEVSVSATTTDGLGLTGEGRGIGATATALLIKRAVRNVNVGSNT